MGTPHSGTRPAASEHVLFQVWDVIDATRRTQGERAALDLARKALEAVQTRAGEETAHDRGGGNATGISSP